MPNVLLKITQTLSRTLLLLLFVLYSSTTAVEVVECYSGQVKTFVFTTDPPECEPYPLLPNMYITLKLKALNTPQEVTIQRITQSEVEVLLPFAGQVDVWSQACEEHQKMHYGPNPPDPPEYESI